MAVVSGDCDDQFKDVRALLERLLASGEECGASVAVNLNGKTVVDLWGGYKDAAKTNPWERNTVAVVWSTTKNIASLAMLILFDRGLISPYDKVSKFWPEFGVNGKEDVEVRMIMSHTSGVSGWERPVSLEDTFDIEKSTAMLAEQAPFWTPGEGVGYHPVTHGHMIGELVKRITGKTLTQFIAEEIATPLQGDFQLGCPESQWNRIATLIAIPGLSPGPKNLEPGTVSHKSMMHPPLDDSLIRAASSRIFRLGEMGAGNGHTNARGLTDIFSVISVNGKANGIRLLKPETIDLIFEEQAFGMDIVMGEPIRFGIGFGLPHPESAVDWLPEGKVCFWSGWGGSVVVMDVERGLTIGYVMNKMADGTLGNARTNVIVKAVYRALGVKS